MFKERLSLILREKKRAQKLTQVELARRLNVTPASISDWKAGRAEPSISMLLNIAGVLKVSVGYLLGEPENPTETLQTWGAMRVIENFPAGTPTHEIDSFADTIMVPLEYLRPGHFAIKVSCDYVAPTILPGDIVITKPCLIPSNHKIVVTRDGLSDKVSLYRIRQSNTATMLIPDRPELDAILLADHPGIEIIGSIAVVYRKS